ncbi:MULTISPECIES: HipA N-terminal domain-containing protein [Rhizobium]|uniref:HipA N-terminal domain-containing protein n=1 Tax=Rhizobium TaxID=379 RepID=UPI000AC82B05|nr:HipA N-terminal domain-containing protein [Rhizobium favelukesii]
MDQETLVYVDLGGASHLVGKLWAHMRKNRESATFEYAPSWLENGQRFALEPALNLGEGAFHTAADRFMFGSIGDSAPDRWGRALMRRPKDAALKKPGNRRALWEKSTIFSRSMTRLGREPCVLLARKAGPSSRITRTPHASRR